MRVRASTVVFGLLGLGRAAPTASSYVKAMPPNAQELFKESMVWMDTMYDKSAGYQYDSSAAAALRHDTRASIWYAFGLLARNEGCDAAEAEKIIRNTIGAQFKVESEEWYGDYQQEPEEPYVGSPAYPPKIYGTWDPNSRGFIGTTLVMAMEEFPHLITQDTQKLILESLHNVTKGDEYRFGHLDIKKDNLYPAYSNPSIMRSLVSGWTGRRLGDRNITMSAEKYAQDIIDLFNEHGTLSEFNSGTYTGVSLFGLVLWSIYLPKDSVMAQNGPRMVECTWDSVAQLWHPGMKNIAGPWDRSYGYDMNRYVSLMGLWLWTFIGKEKSPLIANPQIMSHMGDYCWAPLFAALADRHAKLIPESVVSSLAEFHGEHTFTASAFYPPFDVATRNITTWLSKDLTIGAESYDETVVGGPGRAQEAFNPAVVQWNTGHEVSFISLYPTEKALDVAVSPGKLSLSYPHGNSSSLFTFVVGTFRDKPTVAGWEDVQGLDVSVAGNVDLDYTLSFGGKRGGGSTPLRDFEFWNFTYTMPEGFLGVPTVELDLHVS
ncbi:alpha-L-fucosidase [Purpureocillium lavendulum]|uniref:Alpha-L-fucosidase n=1 Tax=Purpureocillium lavendulum TaxID=1247861 RepID=A0AB34FX66_9HYPO|nr:alpha-L-fucosidase [Purpureocillium lavendulum]